MRVILASLLLCLSSLGAYAIPSTTTPAPACFTETQAQAEVAELGGKPFKVLEGSVLATVKGKIAAAMQKLPPNFNDATKYVFYQRDDNETLVGVAFNDKGCSVGGLTVSRGAMKQLLLPVGEGI